MAGAAMIAAAMSAVEKSPSFISFLLFEADCIGCQMSVTAAAPRFKKHPLTFLQYDATSAEHQLNVI
jgi:hypothetical protein